MRFNGGITKFPLFLAFFCFPFSSILALKNNLCNLDYLPIQMISNLWTSPKHTHTHTPFSWA